MAQQPGGKTAIQSNPSGNPSSHAPQVATVTGPDAMAAFSQGRAASFSDKRYHGGLMPARVGAQIPHRISVKLTLTPPDYSTKQHASSKRLRNHGAFEYGFNEVDANLQAPKESAAYKGTPCATAVKPGAVVIQECIDGTRAGYFDRIESRRPPEAAHLRYACTGPGCEGHRWSDVDSLARDQKHPSNMRGGAAHIYYGVVEYE